MQRLQTILRQRLDGAKRLAVLGIGSELRGDDIAGILVVRRIGELVRSRKGLPKLKMIDGGTAPENCTGELKKFKPTHLVIVDAADLGAKPGDIQVMDANYVGGASFCTHSLPINVMAGYLLQYFECHITLVGIQPQSLEQMVPASKKVLAAVEKLAKCVVEAFD